MKHILLIYGSLQMGGIETLIVRMSKQFSKLGIKITVLLQTRKGNLKLLAELSQHAEIRYLDELIAPNLLFVNSLSQLNWLLPLSLRKVDELIGDVDHVHVFGSFGLVAYARLFSKSNTNHKLSLGVYHQFEYAYSKVRRTYFVKILKRILELFFDEDNIIFFNEASKKTFKEETGINYDCSPLLPIGIDFFKIPRRSVTKINKLKIVSIGRITNFKTYNFQFLNTIESLNVQNIFLEYHIYGTGDEFQKLKSEIKSRGLDSQVFLHGLLDYANFSNALNDAFIFLGSGTALIEASAAGVPALIGIESQSNDLTYGFLHQTKGYSYHEAGLCHEQHSFKYFYDQLARLNDEQYSKECELAFERAKDFSIDIFVSRFLLLDGKLQKKVFNGYRFNRIFFGWSLIVEGLFSLFSKNRQFKNRYHHAE